MKLLLQAGADANIDNLGYSCIFAAVKLRCSKDSLQALIDYGARIISDTKICIIFIRPKLLRSDFVPCFELSGFELNCVTTYKYLDVHIATNLKDGVRIRQQCRNMYSIGNTIIRNLSILQLDVSYSVLIFTVPHYFLQTLKALSAESCIQ